MGTYKNKENKIKNIIYVYIERFVNDLIISHQSGFQLF